jgi:uncharacterized membrane protein YbhN (UPF0104 family)
MGRKAVKPDKSRQQRIVAFSVIGLAILGVLVVALDWREVHRLAGESEWKPVLLALLLCALSYFCLSYSFALVNQLFGVWRGLHYLFGIGYVSSALNNNLSFSRCRRVFFAPDVDASVGNSNEPNPHGIDFPFVPQ